MIERTWSRSMPAWTRSMFLAGTVAQPASIMTIDRTRARCFIGRLRIVFCLFDSDKSGLVSPPTIVGQAAGWRKGRRCGTSDAMSDSSRLKLSGLGASLSGPIGGLSDTPITEVAMTVFGDPDVVPLWFGEGDLVTPDFVRDAAAKGLQAGETFYTWQRGIPELRAALSAYTERLYGIKCRPTASRSRPAACRRSCCAASCCSIPATTS
jgi:hypothetical protein